MVLLLIANGARLNVNTSRKTTLQAGNGMALGTIPGHSAPLRLARSGGHEPIAKLLLKHRAKE